MKKWYLLLSCIVSVVIFWRLFTIASPRDIIRAIHYAAPLGLAGYLVCKLLSTFLRNWRYLILIRATGPPVKIGTGSLFLVTLVRNFFSDLLPARIGSLVYVYILTARFNFPVEIGAATYAVAFVLDFAVMVPLMAYGILLIGIEHLAVNRTMLYSAGGLFFIIACGVVIFLPEMLDRMCRWMRRVAWGGERKEGILRKVHEASEKIRMVYGTRSVWGVIALSVAIRAIKYGCIAFLVFAILHPIDPGTYTLSNIGYWPVFVGASLAEFSASTPVSGVGGFGAYEGVWTAVFTILGYPQEHAVLSGAASHLITQTVGAVLGLLALILLAVPLLKRVKKKCSWIQ